MHKKKESGEMGVNLGIIITPFLDMSFQLLAFFVMIYHPSALEGHIDPWYRGWDMDYTDVDRAKRFIVELQEFEKTGKMPQFIVLRLPNDHTFGTKAGKPTPTAMVAHRASS